MNYPGRPIVLLFCLLALACTNQISAQNKLSVQIGKQLSTKQAKSYHLFTLSTERSPGIDRGIRNVTYLTLDTSELANCLKENAALISYTIPVDGGSLLSFRMMQYDFRTKDFRSVVKTNSGYKNVPEIGGHFYRGTVNQQESSIAAFSFYEEEIGAVFSTPEKGNYNLVLNKENPGLRNENYILYREEDIIDNSKRGSCALTDDAKAMTGPATDKEKTSGKGVYESCKTVKISIFADYLLYARCSSSTVKSSQYVHTLFNVISALYANDDLPLSLSEVVISTIDEGYDYSSSYTVLSHFGNFIQTYTYNGDIAHFMTGYYHPVDRFPSLGGLAWLDVLCAPPTPTTLVSETTYLGPYSMGNVYVSPVIPSLPTYSWDVEVTAHELGHNIGSPHTHSCTWPGGAIDNCRETEGSCSRGPAPVKGGTIMSYCHLVAYGINFANGFGPLPAALLKETIHSNPCLSTGIPENTLDNDSKVIFANAECYDGTWTHYFYNNNTSDLSDDIMILSVDKKGQDIGNISEAGFLIQMRTNAYYAKDTVPAVIAAYADTNWYEINRSWTVQLPAGKQPSAAVTARYPFTDQDIKDISKVLPAAIDYTDLFMVKYANENPVLHLAGAVSKDIRKIKHGITATATSWLSGTETKYKYTEIVLDSGIYGGTLGYAIPDTTSKDPTTGIHERDVRKKINIMPNPASAAITIVLPAESTGIQHILIYDNLGRIVYQEKNMVFQHKLTIDISVLGSGVYTIRSFAEKGGTVYNGIFIKQ